MSRGRGFSGRGSSFRGRGSDGGGWNDSGSRGRGGFSGPSRGRGFNWYKDHSSSFDSRSRYPSGGISSSSGERYSSRGRGDDSYRRYSRMDGPSYSARDHSHHRSPESQRKRMRTDHGYVQASSSRRSHEGSYGGGSDYGNRYGYSEEKGGYGDERGRSYREERRSASSFRDRSREDYPHRKAEQMDSSMPPPSSAPPRHLSSPRGSFRGRISGRGSRGMSRMIFPRRVDTILIRKKSIMDSSYTFRKRMLARSQAENLRRLKLQRLRRLREAALAKKEGGDKEGSKATEDISDDDDDDDDKEEENWDEEDEKAPGVDDDDDDELEEGETPDKKEKKKIKEKKKEVKASDKDEEREEGEEVDDEDEDEEDDGSESGAVPKKLEVKNDGGVHVTIKQDSDVRAVSEESRKRNMPRSTISGRPFIKLSCPHCYMRCITFKEYTLHLYTSKHINMMRKQSLRHKQTLARMRMNQRQKQRIVEESEEVHGSLAPRSNFCPICKLNYRQLKSKHQTSESHRAMKKFLMPYCRVCRIGFKSPMLYENHICSIDHLKRKARLEERMIRLRDRDRDMDDEGSGMDEDKELNMDNFMILDSVGTVDDTGDEDEGEEGKPKVDKDKKEGEEKKKEINLGAEYVKKVEVYYCELCRLYLPRLDQPERALSIHCRTRTHLQRYVRYRDDRALRSKAEKIHHRKEIAKENAAKEAEAKKNSEEKMEADEKKGEDANTSTDANTAAKGSASADSETSKKTGTEGANKGQQNSGSHDALADGGAEGDGDMDQDLESGMDDKLWADVDKDLGELLREVEPGNKSSDEDDDSRAEGGRYDRFRYSEKGSTPATADPASEGDNAKTVTEADETEKKSDVTGKGSKEADNAKSPGDKQVVNDTDSTAAAVAVETK